MQLLPDVTPTGFRILLADSDLDFADRLRSYLELEGYDVLHAQDGAEAMDVVALIDPAALIMDLDLPKVDGLDVLRRLRGDGATLPAIVLTARTDEMDRVAALRMGADDYVTRPFSLLELLERLKIQLRKAHPTTRQIREVEIGDAVVDLTARLVKRGTIESKLCPKEFHLLEVLRQAGGSVVTKQQLLKTVWGFDCEIDTRRVDFQVGRLREKLETNPSYPEHLLTVRGVGYRLVAWRPRSLHHRLAM